MMKRRDFLIHSAKSAAGLALMPRLAIAGSPANSPALAMDVQSQFQRELENKPWLLGWATASREEFDSPPIAVSGKFLKRSPAPSIATARAGMRLAVGGMNTGSTVTGL